MTRPSDDRCPLHIVLRETGTSVFDRGSDGGDVAPIAHRDSDVRGYFHRVITTRVPSPGVEQMENSFDRRLEPGSPSPRPPAVV